MLKKNSPKVKDYKVKVRIRLSSYDHFLLDRVSGDIVGAITGAGGYIKGPIPLPVIRKRFDLLKSPFVHKNHFDQYEISLHRRIMDIIDPSQNILNTLQKLDIPAGVIADMKVIN